MINRTAPAPGGQGTRKTSERAEAAIKDPTKVFASPRDVVADPGLSVEDKRRILTSWIKDAELLATATAESMSGGEPPRLQESKLALAALAQGKSAP